MSNQCLDFGTVLLTKAFNLRQFVECLGRNDTVFDGPPTRLSRPVVLDEGLLNASLLVRSIESDTMCGTIINLLSTICSKPFSSEAQHLDRGNLTYCSSDSPFLDLSSSTPASSPCSIYARNLVVRLYRSRSCKCRIRGLPRPPCPTSSSACIPKSVAELLWCVRSPAEPLSAGHFLPSLLRESALRAPPRRRCH